MHYLRKEEEILGHFAKRGMLRYKDVDAYYCQACTRVIGITCPKCKLQASKGHSSAEATFRRIGDTFERWDGYTWVQIECPKCDFRFKTIVR